MNKFLLLWLEAPLQAWGANSRFNVRDTLKFPTKSGITGLLFCASGMTGEQCQTLEKLANLKQIVISFIKTEEELLLRDFQMVGSGYNEKIPWQRLLKPEFRVGGNSVIITYRYYLQNAKFAVIVELPSDLIYSFAEALKNPIYDIYLGRKCCVPTDFVYRDICDNEQDALDKSLEIAKEKNLHENFRVLDGEHEGDEMVINDVPLRFGTIKQYKDRQITIVRQS